MGIVNRRNAVIGWAVWTAASRLARREANAKAAARKKSEPPAKEQAAAGKKRRVGSAIAVIVAAAVGTAVFVRARGGGEDPEAQ